MVKKTRSGKIMPQTAINSTQGTFQRSSRHIVTFRAIRRRVAQHFTQRSKQHRQKAGRFSERLASGQFSRLFESSSFECAFCLELLVMPVSMACGHVFCRRCLEANSAHSSNCCLCRCPSTQKELSPCLQIETLINKFMVPKQNDSVQYLCRVSQAQEWLGRRTLQQLKVDQIVDFRDSLRVWRRAKVVGFTEEEGKNMVELRVANRPAEQTEKVEITSKRLAPSLFFTRKRYMQEYGPSLMTQNDQRDALTELSYRNCHSMGDMEYYEVRQREQEEEDEVEQASQFQRQSEQSVELNLTMALFNHEMNHLEEILF